MGRPMTQIPYRTWSTVIAARETLEGHHRSGFITERELRVGLGPVVMSEAWLTAQSEGRRFKPAFVSTRRIGRRQDHKERSAIRWDVATDALREMPKSISNHFRTPAQMAVLVILARELRRFGSCTLSLDEIGDKASCHRNTARGVLKHAMALGAVKMEERRQKGAKSLTNVVTVDLESDLGRELQRWLDGSRKGEGIGYKGIFPSRDRSIESSFKRDVTVSATLSKQGRAAQDASSGRCAGPLDPSIPAISCPSGLRGKPVLQRSSKTHVRASE